MDKPFDIARSTLGRRGFLMAGGSLAATFSAPQMAQAALETGKVEFPRIDATSEAPEQGKPLPLPDREKIGYAIVGLGRLAINQILPAFGQSRYSRPVALVSGDRAKATKVARQYGIKETSIYDYAGYERLADNPEVQVIYIVLPNGLHAEYVIRGAKLGKHILCEKPMANSVAECQQMIDACKAAGRKLMVAYRSQYEPMDRAIVKMARDGKLGALKMFSAFNVQNQGDPNQWRLKRALSGGGAMPDIGLYCLNAARFMSGEEPVQVSAQTWSTPGDPRFTEVEESVQFILKFPSGLLAQCAASYSGHESKSLRLMGSLGWAEMNPAFAYTGLELSVGSVVDGKAVLSKPSIDSGDQFAHEMDHMSRCVIDDLVPHTPGEEGLQDQRITEAIYRSAREGKSIAIPPPTSAVRGAELPASGD